MGTDWIICGSCKSEIEFPAHYCDMCGARLDFSDVKSRPRNIIARMIIRIRKRIRMKIPLGRMKEIRRLHTLPIE